MSFYMKDHPELLYFKTIDELMDFENDILRISQQGYLTVRQLADLRGVKLPSGWDACGWTKEILRKDMQVECHDGGLYPYRIVLPDEEMLKMEEKPKIRHEYTISGNKYDAYSRSCDDENEDELASRYSIRIDTTNPEVYHAIFATAGKIIEAAQKEEEK